MPTITGLEAGELQSGPPFVLHPPATVLGSTEATYQTAVPTR